MKQLFPVLLLSAIFAATNSRGDESVKLPFSIELKEFESSKVLLEVRNFTGVSWTIDVEAVCNSKMNIYAEADKPAPGRTKVVFFPTKIGSNAWQYSGHSKEGPETINVMPNETFSCWVDISERVAEVQAQFPNRPIYVRVDFLGPLRNLEVLKPLMEKPGHKFLSNILKIQKD
jgi:hypothetical protein